MITYMKQVLSKIILKFIRILYKIIGIGFGSSSVKLEFNLVKKLIKNGSVFVDCGANVGNYTKEILNYFPESEIHIFEPSKHNINILEDKFKLNKNIKINALGLSNKNEGSILFSDKIGSGLGSLTKRRLDHFGIEFNMEEKIELIRLDQYWSKSINSNFIDLLKIDVEGHEMDVLKGLGDKIKYVRAIQFEFGGCNIDSRSYFQDFWYFFKENNFKIFRISPIGLIEIKKYSELNESFITTNFISLNKTLDKN